MKSYGRLFALPGTKLPALASLVARLPFGMTPLALVFLVESSFGSYSAAGIVSGAHAVGIGVAGPVQGRLVDRFGQTRVLVPTAMAYAALLGALVAAIGAAAPVGGLVVLGFIAGAAFPPIAACARVAWASFLRGSPLRDTAYAVDAVIVELAFVCGPLVVAAVLAVATPAAAALTSAAMSLSGTLVFAASRASRSAVDVAAAAHAGGGALRSAGIRTLVITFAVMSIAFGVVEVAIPAFADNLGSQESAGVLLSSLAAGSLLGGLVYGARQWPGAVATRYRVLLLTFGIGLLLLPVAGSLTTMGVALFVSGLTLAPAVICAYLLVEHLAVPGTVTEAFSWTTTGNVIGTAAGAAVAGVVTDAIGPQMALVIGASSVVAAAVFAWATRESVSPQNLAAPAPETTRA